AVVVAGIEAEAKEVAGDRRVDVADIAVADRRAGRALSEQRWRAAEKLKAQSNEYAKPETPPHGCLRANRGNGISLLSLSFLHWSKLEGMNPSLRVARLGDDESPENSAKAFCAHQPEA